MPTDPLVERLSAMKRPRVASDQPLPERGQLWRAAWQGTASLVLILETVDDRSVTVLGATADSIGDDAAVLAETDAELRPTIWTSQRARIKLFSLEHRITNLSDDSLAEVERVAAAEASGAWAPISDDIDDRTLIRLELGERLQSLADAEWVPTVEDGEVTLEEQVSAAELTSSDVAAALGVAPGSARRLLQGKREPSEDEANALTKLLGANPAVRVQFDDDLVSCLDQPEFRPAIRLIAERDHAGNDVAARRTFAGQMLALAARHREPGDRNWSALIRDALRED